VVVAAHELLDTGRQFGQRGEGVPVVVKSARGAVQSFDWSVSSSRFPNPACILSMHRALHRSRGYVLVVLIP
jgi:hypothetical protein